MNKVLILSGFYLGMWGVLGFFITLILGFIYTLTGWSHVSYFVLLVLFALFGIAMTCRSVSKCCKKYTEVSW